MNFGAIRAPRGRLAAGAGALLALALAAGAVAAQEQKAPPPLNALAAVVGLVTDVPGQVGAGPARKRRWRSATVIDAEGLVLTIGYVSLETGNAEILAPDGTMVPATAVGYDRDSGFGLFRAHRPLGVRPLRLGDSSALEVGDPVLAVSHSGHQPVVAARVAERRDYAGYWEYLLEDAIFTEPAQTSYDGAALIGEDGRLLGVGSLLLAGGRPGMPPSRRNMFIPINRLKAVLGDLLERGRPARPPRPWMGLATEERHGRLVVAEVIEGGPAEGAGIRAGDIIVGVGGTGVKDLAGFLRQAWSWGGAGTNVPLDVLPMASNSITVQRMDVLSVDHGEWLERRGGP